MNIVQMQIKDIIPYERNAKKHDDKQIKNVTESIKQFGITQPLVVDKDNVLIIGHCRLIACKRLKMKEVPVVRMDELTPEQVDKLRLLDNKLNESEWDFDLLAEDIPALDFSGFDIDWQLPEIKEETEVIEDEVPEVPEEPKAKLGDIYQLGNHRLMCGDSTKAEDVEKLMNGVKADMVFTDPPYGMNLDTDFSSMKSKLFKGKTGGQDYMQVKGDNDDFSEALIDTIFNNFNYCPEIFIWGADYFAELIPNRNDGSWIVWDKRSNNQDDIEADESSDKMYGSCFELCWSKVKHKRNIARIKWAGIFGIDQEFDHKRHHPTQKPVKLSTWFLNRYSKDQDNIVDIYGGSGSTLIACEQLNRRCFMMEYEPAYIDVIIDRWESFTGQKAIKL